jgi:lipopolysaccharide/colanic/teichoic acid biosynthesis glycosyltransferase
MTPQADKIGPEVTYNDDPRITRLGRFLRRTKMDELPSLINVLRGDMSLVGPRPESPYWVAKYTEDEVEVLIVKPGVTGYSQIKYRNEENMLHGEHLEEEYKIIMKDKIKADINYIKNRSFWEDFRILFITARILFH